MTHNTSIYLTYVPDIHGARILQCSHASVRLTQARPNNNFVFAVRKLKESPNDHTQNFLLLKHAHIAKMTKVDEIYQKLIETHGNSYSSEQKRAWAVSWANMNLSFSYPKRPFFQPSTTKISSVPSDSQSYHPSSTCKSSVCTTLWKEKPVFHRHPHSWHNSLIIIGLLQLIRAHKSHRGSVLLVLYPATLS